MIDHKLFILKPVVVYENESTINDQDTARQKFGLKQEAQRSRNHFSLSILVSFQHSLTHFIVKLSMITAILYEGLVISYSYDMSFHKT